MTHVLIVDDNPFNLRLARDVLEDEGFTVETAVDTVDAKARIDARLPDVILMDIALPGKDGLTFTSELKAAAPTAGVPVLALTAFAMKGDEERAMLAGCAGYITKPINTRTFGRIVREHAQRLEGGAP